MKNSKTDFKNVGTPVTVKEKYDKLALKNEEIHRLKEVFGLDISL